MFFIIYAPLQFFLLYRLGPFAQVSVADDLFQAVCCRSFIQIRKIKGKSCIASQIVIYIRKPCTAAGQINALFCDMISICGGVRSRKDFISVAIWFTQLAIPSLTT